MKVQSFDLQLEETYRRYGPMVFRRCLRLLGDRELAVDATQEVFAKLVELGSADVRSPSSLLYVMATRHCLNRIRARRRRPEERDERLYELACADDLEDRAGARSVLGWLFAREPESSGVIAVLHWVDGLTLEQTAAEVGMSVSGVRRRLRVLHERLATSKEVRR